MHWRAPRHTPRRSCMQHLVGCCDCGLVQALGPRPEVGRRRVQQRHGRARDSLRQAGLCLLEHCRDLQRAALRVKVVICLGHHWQQQYMNSRRRAACASMLRRLLPPCKTGAAGADATCLLEAPFAASARARARPGRPPGRRASLLLSSQSLRHPGRGPPPQKPSAPRMSACTMCKAVRINIQSLDAYLAS